MKLDEFYTVEPDTACWTLTYEKIGDINPKTGKPTITRDASYHANLKQALVKYLDNCLKSSADIQDVKNRITEVEQKIENLNTSGNPATVETKCSTTESGETPN